jgi:hypothetical protein
MPQLSMKYNPYLTRRKLQTLYRKLISIWVDDSELTQDMYDNFLVKENSDSLGESGQPVILMMGKQATQKQLDKFRRQVSQPLDLIEADKNPLWKKYVVETVVVPKIDENDGIPPPPEPSSEPLPPVPIGGGGKIGGGAMRLS